MYNRRETERTVEDLAVLIVEIYPKYGLGFWCVNNLKRGVYVYNY